jgi:hypothetical protein
VHLTGVPKIYRVQQRGELFAIVMERVTPLTILRDTLESFAMEELPDFFPEQRGELISAVYELEDDLILAWGDWLRNLQQRALGDMDSKGYVSRATGRSVLAAMEAFEDQLRDTTASTDEYSDLLRSAADAVHTLRSLKIACPDLHPGNWGARLTADRSRQTVDVEMVIFDFGVSSGAQTKDLNLEVLEE